MKTETLVWISVILSIAIIVALAYLIFRPQDKIIDYAAMRKIQQEILAEELKKIPKDSLIIERYYTIREVSKKQLSEFEQADSLKKDSLFWHYFLSWKAEK